MDYSTILSEISDKLTNLINLNIGIYTIVILVLCACIALLIGNLFKR